MELNFIHWNIDPEIITLAGFPLRYYGIFFAGGILLCLYVLKWIFKKEGISPDKLDTLTIYGVLGIFAGARLAHCLFYEPSYYFSHPLEMVLPIRQGANGGYEFTGYAGLASHGGAAGLLLALLLYSKKTGESLMNTLDLIAVVAALGGCFIRLGNLMNSEIIGTPTDQPWGFVFERVDDVARHPAQLYEAISYVLIFMIMVVLYKTQRTKLPTGFLFGLAITLIFTARFVIEFMKEDQVGFEAGMIFNMGQLLSVPYIVAGIAFMAGSFIKAGRFRMI